MLNKRPLSSRLAHRTVYVRFFRHGIRDRVFVDLKAFERIVGSSQRARAIVFT